MPIEQLSLPTINYLGMKMMDELDELPAQLRDFQLQKSHCFCCSNNHQHLLTGKQMICDRELVYQSLTDIYSRDIESVDPLERFNSRVRERLAPRILRANRLHLPLRYAVTTLFVSNLPLLSELIWVIHCGPQRTIGSAHYVVWCTRLILDWAYPCLAMVIFLANSEHLWNARKISFFKNKRICLSFLLAPIQGLTTSCVWGVPVLTRMTSEDDSLLPLIPFSLALLFAVLLHLF